MTERALDIAGELRGLIADGRISSPSLTAITGIGPEGIAAFANSVPGRWEAPTGLSAEGMARLTALVAQLTEGLEIDDDVRLRAIVETLSVQFGLTRENIALLTKVPLDDLNASLGDPPAASHDVRFRVAMRVNYLFQAVANAVPKPSWR